MSQTLDAALFEAIAARWVEEVHSLLVQGANANAPDPDPVSSPYERTPLREALEPAMECPPTEVLEGQTERSAIVRLLLEYGADPNADTPLLKATYFGLVESVRLLLEYGADPNQENSEAIHDAEQYQFHTIHQMLVEAGEQRQRVRSNNGCT